MLASFLDRSGRAEIIWFPFTPAPWLKVWTVAPRRPRGSRPVRQPYPYVFADAIPAPLSKLLGEVLRGNGPATPAFCAGVAAASAAGLAATATQDLWGWSGDVLRYSRPTTMRYGAAGWVVHCRRADVQQVVHDLWTQHRAMVEAAAAAGDYPMNGPVEIRVTGLDRAADCLVRGAEPPALSALRPRADRPEWDTAVWFNALTYPGTRGALEFYERLERWVFDHFDGTWAQARAEWSKGFAYSSAGAQTDDAALTETIPATFPSDPGRRNGWAGAARRLDRLDPHRTFSNPFLDRLLP
jgi:FAD/FMN-containing dehydrogenase